MPLQKQAISINFAEGLDQKGDPFQLKPGKFLSLKNSVFSTTGRLQKRNGFSQLASLPDTTSTYVTTFNGNLTAIGQSLEAYSMGSETWVNKGAFQPLELSTLPLIRNNLNQSQSDSSIAANGLICTVYTEVNNTTSTYKYAVADSVTGQNIVAPTEIPGAGGVVTGSPRVFLLGNYFVIVFTNVIAATNHLQFIAINTTLPTSVTVNADLSTTYTPSTTVNFDGVVVNNSLYVAYNSSAASIKMTYLDSTLLQHNTVTFAGRVATLMSVAADSTGSTPIIYAVFYDLASTTGYALAVNQQLNTVLAPTLVIAAGTVLNITSVAQSGVCTFYYEVSNNYSYDGAIPTHFIDRNTITQAGVVGTAGVLVRSVGLASKAFLLTGRSYFLAVYNSTYQPTYFLINDSGKVISQLAYENAGPYYTKGLPNASVDEDENTASISYLRKDLISATNKTQGAAALTASPVYSQTGVNLSNFKIGTSKIITAEIGQNLLLTGGFLWMYDGYQAVENNFFLYPDSVEVTTSATGGLLTAQQYFYQVTYEWSDNQGNVFRSAPSIPVSVTTTGATSSNTVNVPTLRLTHKTANPVKIVIYRWSTAQQTYYQVTSLTAPTLNSTTTDSIAFVDVLADSAILGNNIIYTTGGVVENIGPPSFSDISLFKSRLLGVDSEDTNLLWYSKQVINSTPVEMSDLFSMYIAPTTGAQGSTSGMKFTAPMDDKAIIFKKDALYYITGNGPDNTGANNDFSEPIFITATVGSENKSSLVFIPQGLMFQSDKGIWLLGRDLSTQYIGAAVQNFNQYTVQSAVNVPGTNQVRFTLSNGQTLMYDYFENQWGIFEGTPCISSTLFEGLHTFINQYGQVFQESPNTYLDGTNPVLMSFTTSWLNLAGLQGYERLYYFYLLGTFLSPHKLAISIAYDYNSNPTQQSIIVPDNYNATWGGDATWGANALWGGQPALEQWRIFAQRQRCEAFQITVQEIFDSSYGVPAGAGFTMSGINSVVGLKKAYRPIAAKNTVG